MGTNEITLYLIILMIENSRLSFSLVRRRALFPLSPVALYDFRTWEKEQRDRPFSQ
jgi:hypothetical protein